MTQMNDKILILVTWIGYVAGLMMEAMPIFQGISFLISIIAGIVSIVYIIKKIKKLK